MEQESIIKALLPWNLWGGKLELGIIRKDYVNEALSYLKADKIVTLVGARRVGKSFIARQIADSFAGKDKHNTLIVNFEEVRFDEEMDQNFLVKVYDAYMSIIKPDKKPLIILDEVQEVKGWEKFVRSVYEKKESFFVVTGSSAKIMSEELATLLTGRTLPIEVFPLSFKWFLEFKGLRFKNKLDIIRNEKKIKELFKEYASFGALPEVVLDENVSLKLKILRSYYDDILNKDVVKRFNVRRIDKLERIAFHYITNSSSLITFNRTGKFLKLDEKIVEMYSKYLVSSRLFFFLERFSSSVKEQENSPRKVYLKDVGFNNLSNISFSDKISKIYENIVAIHLLREEGRNLFYWKDYSGREVDFVIKDGTKVKQIIQVCYDPQNADTKEREIQSLLKAVELFNLKEGWIITHDYGNKEFISNKKIVFIPLWKWLLEREEPKGCYR